MQELTTEIPPDDLLYLVSGHADRVGWGASRRAAVIDVIIPLLEQAQTKFPAHILDLGCGCGRILAGWEGLLNGATLSGVDINQRLVAFCQEKIGFARVARCGPYPPLSFKDDTFDFVYAASVFTHMRFVPLLQWATEMARIVMPGGTLMVSFHGAYYEPIVEQQGAQALHKLRERGWYVHLYGKADETFEGSNLYATFLTTEFVRTLFRGFELKALRLAEQSGPSHFAAHQDIAVFRRTED
jgi:SAM-dependent methyltransferase